MGDALGIPLQLGACFFAALGYVLQKRAHLRRIASGSKEPLWKSPVWLSGLLSMILSAGLAVGSSPLLDQSKQAPLGAVTIVFSSLLAALLLGEILTVLDAISTAIIITGTVVAVTSNNAASSTYTFEETAELLDDVVVWCYTALLLTLFLVGGMFVERLSRKEDALWSARSKMAFSLVAPALGGFCQGYTGYSSKVIATVAFEGETEGLRNPAFYAYVVLLVVAVVLQVRWLNAGLAHFTALQIIPVFQTCIIFSNSLAVSSCL